MWKLITIIGCTLGLAIAGCATAPRTAGGRDRLEVSAESTLNEMIAQDPGIRSLLDSAAGYAVFPDITKGGLVVGGAWGRGVLFRRGQPVGFVQLSQGSAGLQAGGQTLAELIVFRDEAGVARLEAGTFELGANISAVVIKSGASAGVRFADGVAVLQLPHGGIMVEATVNGQKLDFVPRG